MSVRFVLLAVTYLAFAGHLSGDECVAAVLAAATLTSASLAVHQRHAVRFRFAPATVARQVLQTLPKLVTDSLKLIPRMLLGGWRTGMMSQEFIGNARPADDAAWWAIFTLTTSLPPSSYVVSRLARPGEVIIHRLIGPPHT
ncbi:MAG TPA: hypothetical protein VGC09_09575 [Rhodopila sp.]